MAEEWTCPDCAEGVTADAAACPYCGHARGASASVPVAAARLDPPGGAAREGPPQEPQSGRDAPPPPEPRSERDTPLPPEPPPGREPASDSAEELRDAGAWEGIALLRQLAALREEGVITSEDFETKKAEILRRL